MSMITWGGGGLDYCRTSAEATEKTPVFHDNLMSTDFALAAGGMGRELACGEITKPLIHNMFFTCDFLYAGSRMYRNIMQWSLFQLWCPHILCFDVIILLPKTQLPSFPKVLTNATKCLSGSH
jgi:hypothetical protein